MGDFNLNLLDFANYPPTDDFLNAAFRLWLLPFNHQTHAHHSSHCHTNWQHSNQFCSWHYSWDFVLWHLGSLSPLSNHYLLSWELWLISKKNSCQGILIGLPSVPLNNVSVTSIGVMIIKLRTRTLLMILSFLYSPLTIILIFLSLSKRLGLKR